LKAKRPDSRAQAKRAALNALRRVERKAVRAGIELSSWEGEFLGSLSDRIKTFGRAFGDPDKGAPGQILTPLQMRKLKEIKAKADGYLTGSPRPFRSRSRTKTSEDPT
jgi:hypothetical protein